MFSNFGNIFITRPRHAESTDTRLGIRQHDPDQESRKKKDENAEPVSAFETDDSATVTVDALRAFLENFLKTVEGKKDSNANVAISAAAHDMTLRGADPTPHVDGKAAHAAGVYQHVAQKVDRTAAPVVSQDAADTQLLGEADVRILYTLIEDLKPLAASGVEYLTIERSESFLQSLVNAVAKAKTL